MRLKFWNRKSNESILTAPTADGQPRMLGTYQVNREIGRGSMAVVYLGRDMSSGRAVAIKTINLASTFNADVMQDTKERFMVEAEILTRLRHPDIVTIYDVGEEHGLAYIAMEFLKGAELTEYTTQDKLLPVPKVMEIMARTADALGYAHEEGREKGIVHRDVKPGNIMYDPSDNSVKVTDFGISQLIDLKAKRVGLVLGTPFYMSPEQVMDQQLTGVSDLFSLGSTFYQLLCGKVPFEGDSEFEVMNRIVREPHTDILTLRQDLLADVCAVINRALEKNSQNRYQSGREMAEAIRRCAQYGSDA